MENHSRDFGCEFTCDSVNKRPARGGMLYTYQLLMSADAVMPVGKLEISAYQEGLFEPGKEYFLTVTSVPAEESEPMDVGPAVREAVDWRSQPVESEETPDTATDEESKPGAVESSE